MEQPNINQMNNNMQEQRRRFDEFDKSLAYAREISRDAIYRVIVLSASIVGFSVSLFSVPIIQSSLNISKLRLSWYLFLGTIIIGFFILLFEGRVKYAKTWKNFQLSKFPDYPNQSDYTNVERIYSLLFTIITLIYPANLLFNRIYQNQDEKDFKERVNGLVVQKLVLIEHILIFLEVIFFAG